MAKLLIEIDKEPRANDVLVFDGERWEAVSTRYFLKDIQKEINVLKAEHKELVDNLTILQVLVNQKLEEYHNILQIVSKEE